MRIALVASSFPPFVGGVEEHVRNVAHVLSARGHDVVVWTVARDGKFAIRAVEGIEVWDLPTPLPARSIMAVLRFLVRLPAAAAYWLRAARAARNQVIHIHCFGPNGTYGWLLATLLRTPFIVSSHGETLADDNGMFHSSALARSSLRAALSRAAAVTGCSQVALDDLESRFGLERRRGRRVFNGIDLDEESAASVEGLPVRYIAAIGRQQPLKGFDLLIDAFARSDLDADVQLVIAGDGPERAALASHAAGLGMQDRLLLPGWLPRAQVGRFLAQSLAIAVPSRFEAFGITVLEAWRAGRPLVATTHGGPAEFVEDGVDGLLRDPLDPDAFGEALRSVVEDREHADSLALAGLRKVAGLTWDRTADDYEELYRGLTS